MNLTHLVMRYVVGFTFFTFTFATVCYVFGNFDLNTTLFFGLGYVTALATIDTIKYLWKKRRADK